MFARQLIMAVLMLLSLSAQASTALLGCERTGPATAGCCDPHQQIHRCPAPGRSRLFCDQVSSTDMAAGVSATLEREQQPVTPDPTDESTALAAYFYELLSTADPPAPVRQPLELAVARYPTHPTYLATARLRL